MNEFAEIAMSFEDKALPIRHIPGPQGVRGRNSDNTLIREKIGWEPSISIREGLREVRPAARALAIRVGMSPPLLTHIPLVTTDVLLDQGADREGARRRHPQ